MRWPHGVAHMPRGVHHRSSIKTELHSRGICHEGWIIHGERRRNVRGLRLHLRLGRRRRFGERRSRQGGSIGGQVETAAAKLVIPRFGFKGLLSLALDSRRSFGLSSTFHWCDDLTRGLVRGFGLCFVFRLLRRALAFNVFVLLAEGSSLTQSGVAIAVTCGAVVTARRSFARAGVIAKGCPVFCHMIEMQCVFC